MRAKKSYIVNLANIPGKKACKKLQKGMYFDEKDPGNKSTRDRSHMRLLKSPNIMVSASGVLSSLKIKSFSKTRILSSDANDFCDRLKLLLQEKQACNDNNIVNEEIVAVADNLLEYKCRSTKQHKFSLLKGSN